MKKKERTGNCQLRRLTIQKEMAPATAGFNIVEGRGKNRKVLELPHGSVFAAAAKSEPEECKQIIGSITERILCYS